MSDETKIDQSEQPAGAAAAADKCKEDAAECPEIHLAAEALRLAKIELEKAEKFYDDVYRRAAEKINSVRETTVGDVLDNTLETVKKHPCPSLIVSAALGFCLGRWFQRLFFRK
jgi:hypothetical protein